MKYQTYIEAIVFNNSSSSELEQFNFELLENPVLREEYEQYLETIECIRSAELSIIENSSLLDDFRFDPEIEVLIQSYHSSTRYQESNDAFHRSLKSIINSQTGGKDNHRRGWLKSAATFALIILAFCTYEINKPSIIDISEINAPQYVPTILRGHSEKDKDLIKIHNYFSRCHPDSVLKIISRLDTAICDPLLEPVCLMELNRPAEASFYWIR